jgi:hypothetical protein
MTTGRINQIAFLLKDLQSLRYSSRSERKEKKPKEIQSATAHAGRGFAKESIVK